MKKKEEKERAAAWEEILQHQLYKQYLLERTLAGQSNTESLARIDETEAFYNMELAKRTAGLDILRASLLLFKDAEESDNNSKSLTQSF